MAWKPGANSSLGLPQPASLTQAQLDTTPKVGVGTIATFIEDTQGGATLIYLPGVANLVAGDAVVYDLTPGSQSVTRLANNAQNNTGRQVAIAVDAPLAGQYGWFQIRGLAIVNTVAAQAAGAAFATATAGQLGSAADAGDQILNARLCTARDTPVANKAYMQIQYPCMQGQIT